MEKLSFLSPLRLFVMQINYILNVPEKIQTLLKNNGFNAGNAEPALNCFAETGGCYVQAVKEKVSDYFREMLIRANGKNCLLFIRHN